MRRRVSPGYIHDNKANLLFRYELHAARHSAKRSAALLVGTDQVAARLARSLDAWRKLAEPYRSHANAALQRVASQKNLSKDVREIIDKSRT